MEHHRLYGKQTLLDMKKLYFVPLFLSITTLAFSQRKPEFGFIVKAGNYALPYHNTEYKTQYGGINTYSLTYNPGSIYTLGIWHALPLGDYLRLSGELLYQSTRFTIDAKNVAVYPDRSYQSNERQTTNKSSLSLPVKLHLFFKKDGKASIAIGGGVSRDFSANIRIRRVSQFPSYPESISDYSTRISNSDNFEMRFNLSAGFHYQIDSKTAIGLEYTYEKPSIIYQTYPNIFIDTIDYRIASYIQTSIQPKMNSFSVSLRHNILD